MQRLCKSHVTPVFSFSRLKYVCTTLWKAQAPQQIRNYTQFPKCRRHRVQAWVRRKTNPFTNIVFVMLHPLQFVTSKILLYIHTKRRKTRTNHCFMYSCKMETGNGLRHSPFCYICGLILCPTMLQEFSEGPEPGPPKKAMNPYMVSKCKCMSMHLMKLQVCNCGNLSRTKFQKIERTRFVVSQVFLQEQRKIVQAENSHKSVREVVSHVAAMWRELPQAERKPYEEKAQIDKARFNEECAKYDFAYFSIFKKAPTVLLISRRRVLPQCYPEHHLQQPVKLLSYFSFEQRSWLIIYIVTDGLMAHRRNQWTVIYFSLRYVICRIHECKWDKWGQERIQILCVV